MSVVCILSKIQQIHPFVSQRKALPSCLSPSVENNSSRPGWSISDAKCLLRWMASHFQLIKCFSQGSFTGTFRSGDARARSPCLLSLSRIKLRAFHGLGASQTRNLKGKLTLIQNCRIRKRSTDSVIPAGCHTCGWQPDFLKHKFPLQSQSSTASNRIDQVLQLPTLALPSKPKTSVQPQKLKACPVAWGTMELKQRGLKWLRWLKQLRVQRGDCPWCITALAQIRIRQWSEARWEYYCTSTWKSVLGMDFSGGSSLMIKGRKTQPCAWAKQHIFVYWRLQSRWSAYCHSIHSINFYITWNSVGSSVAKWCWDVVSVERIIFLVHLKRIFFGLSGPKVGW